MVLLITIFIVMLLIILVFAEYYYLPSRHSLLLSSVNSFLGGLLGSIDLSFNIVFVPLLIFLLLINLTSNLPFSVTPVLYYCFTITISLVMWVGLIILIFNTQLNVFLAHLIPFGAPMFLSVLLPLVELFSHLIRPLTLMVRLSTNLSAGHIMLFIFSYFSLASSGLALVLLVLLILLMLLELIISALQAYIFTSLSWLYVSESI